MQITLNEAEILQALETYVRSQINVSKNQDIKIDLKAGRGENGYSATLDIVAKALSQQIVTRDASQDAAASIRAVGVPAPRPTIQLGDINPAEDEEPEEADEDDAEDAALVAAEQESKPRRSLFANQSS